MTELDQRAVLDRVLQAAREITGARYAALGILNEQRSELEQFLTFGRGRRDPSRDRRSATWPWGSGR
jgi:hypothetical protein